jgi:hypothetical protein
MKARSIIIGVLGIAALAAVGYAAVPRAPEPAREAVPAITGQQLQFEIADTPEERERGFSGRADVPGGYGLLFVFDRADRYGFWMKDMLVPIDIIWLQDDGTILGIEEAVSPDTYPTPFYPPEPVRFVLETRAGEARAQGWEVGTRIALPDSR